MGRFYIKNNKIIDADSELSSIHFDGEIDFYELCDFLNDQEIKKLEHKRKFKTLQYRIKKLVEVENV